VFWVISVYFNIRNTLPKFGSFLLGHPVYSLYIDATVVPTRYVGPLHKIKNKKHSSEVSVGVTTDRNLKDLGEEIVGLYLKKFSFSWFGETT